MAWLDKAFSLASEKGEGDSSVVLGQLVSQTQDLGDLGEQW